MRRRIGMIHSQERMEFMLKFDGLRMMREMKLGASPHESASFHDLDDQEKTQPDGSPVTLLDLLIDKRYAEREYDSDYYASDYYYSEQGSQISSSDDEEEE